MKSRNAVFVALLAIVCLAAIPMVVPEFIEFGEGTEGSTPPGGDPFKPTLQGFGTPSLGSDVNLYLMNCRGNEPGYLIMGLSRNDQLAFGGTIYPSLGLVQPIWITALGGNPPVGYWSYTGLRIPSNPSIQGLSIYMQAISRDSGNPFNVTLSNGLEMRIE